MTITNTSWNLVNTYAGLPDFFYSKIDLSKVSSPHLVVLNNDLAEHLGLDTDELKSREGVAVLSGNALPEGSIPLALAYAGHQFGYFTMLGDGRAMLLGEQVTPHGIYDIHLKGSGKTPYSRGGDGRAALSPMLREYIVSEAMHNLKIPTSRSLAVVTTGDYVLREKILKGAVLTRTARSHIRVGTFEYAAYFGTEENVRQLADYTIDRHYREAAKEDNPYLGLLKEVVKRQASLIAKWQLIGFVHGVMNTDNMAISGETIDYGPCAFMDAYDPEIVYSSIDTYGRYAYKNQPRMGLWNLSRFGETLLPLIHENRDKAVQLAQDAVNEFYDLYHKAWISGYYLATDTSDENGSVSVFELPVLTDENEMYNVSVRAQGFCPALIFSVPIYPDITTTYNVYLRDIGITGEPNFYFILQPAIPGRGTDSP